MSKHSVFCWTVSPWFLQCLTTDTFRLYNQLLPMLPIWAGWEIPIRLEVYSAPTRKLHQLTNNLITYHLSQYPNQTLGLVPSCAFGDFKVTRTKMLRIECMKFLVYQTNKKMPPCSLHSQWYLGLPLWLRDKESACQWRRRGVNAWSRKFPHAVEPLSPWATTVQPIINK